MPTSTTNNVTGTWHRGEIAIQKSAGVAERMKDHGPRVVRSFMPEQHRDFYRQLPFLVAGAVDQDGDVWATVLAGYPGFVSTPSETILHFAHVRDQLDPANAGLNDGASIGLLGIELHTRRRNRVNGVVRRSSFDSFDLSVEQSYGNCPQYIQLRDFEFVQNPSKPSLVQPELVNPDSVDIKRMVEGADTFFVATYFDQPNGHRQVDVSHRGGKPGFIRVSEDGIYTIPDFAGNLFFNTLGNILENGKAGLIFVDFEGGTVFQFSGEAKVLLDSPEIAAFQGAERLWQFYPKKIYVRKNALALRWKSRADGASPNALMTGDWTEAAVRLKASALADVWRPFRVSRVVDESSTIRSFYLEPADGNGLIPHAPGQHLPIRVTLPAMQKPIVRSYTLSVAPSDRTYRISVKKQGRVSAFLHDELVSGALIEARSPVGNFTFDALSRRPAVMLAAGVGITPMIAMLRDALYEGRRKRKIRPVWLFYSARSSKERAFTEEIRALLTESKGAFHTVRVLSDPVDAQMDVDYDVHGRIDIELLKRVLPFNDYDFYLCGPETFTQSMYDGLRELNIADSRIHAEAFGPSSLVRKIELSEAVKPMRPAATKAVEVRFQRSGKTIQWGPESGTLLELAESHELAVDFNCRRGTCGACRASLTSGTVTYAVAPEYMVGDAEVLLCCAFPSEETSFLDIDL